MTYLAKFISLELAYTEDKANKLMHKTRCPKSDEEGFRKDDILCWFFACLLQDVSQTLGPVVNRFSANFLGIYRLNEIFRTYTLVFGSTLLFCHFTRLF